MKDILSSILANADAFRWLFFLVLVWALYRYIHSGCNPLRWWHFISSKGADGSYYADLNKLGQVTGIAFGSFSVLLLSSNAKADFVGFAAVLTAYFAFVGGVAGYSAYLRSKSGQVQTTTVTEPVSAPVKTTTTTTEPAATKDNPVPVVIAAGPGKEEPMKVEEQTK